MKEFSLSEIHALKMGEFLHFVTCCFPPLSHHQKCRWKEERERTKKKGGKEEKERLFPGWAGECGWANRVIWRRRENPLSCLQVERKREREKKKKSFLVLLLPQKGEKVHTEEFVNSTKTFLSLFCANPRAPRLSKFDPKGEKSPPLKKMA